MTNRNILNQNTNNRNILNVRPQKLKDGKAIKINTSITNKNEIDVNFITNTSETITFEDNDLFLVSDPTGTNIQYISGLRIKQGAASSLVGGNNITLTPIANTTQINVNSDLTGITSINGYNANVLTLNNNNQQILVKDTGKNFTNGDILAVDSNNKLTNITATNIISNIEGGNNITRSGNTINLDSDLTNMVSIDSTSGLILKNSSVNRVSIGASSTRFHAYNTTLGGILLIDKGTGGQADTQDYELLQDYLSNGFRSNKIDTGLRIRRKGNDNYDQFFCGNQQDEGKCVIINPNNDLHYIFRSGKLKITPPNEGFHNFSIDLGNSSSTFTLTNAATTTIESGIFKTCNARFTAKNSSDSLYLFNGALLSDTIGSNKEFLQQAGNGSFLLLRGNTISFKHELVESLSLTANSIDLKKPMASSIDMNSNPIYLRGGTNFNHYIKFDDGTGINGVEISGFGASNQRVFRLVSQGGGGEIFSAYNDQIEIFKPIDMRSQPIRFKTNNDDHFIEYSSSNMDGLEIGGLGGLPFSQPIPFLRIKNTRTDETTIECFDRDPTNSNVGRITHVYNKLSVVKNNATLQNDSNDIFTVRNVGFCKAIIHSDNNVCELALRTNNRQAVIKYHTNQLFEIVTDSGEFKVEVGNNSCNFFNNNGRLSYQSDRNLVIYNTANNPVFASNTSVSERRFKDNIVSLNLENSYNIIKQLNPVSFVYKEDINTPKKGFIVDEIEDKIPECIKAIDNCGECENMTSKLLYKEDIVPDLVASVKYLISKVESQETTISNLNQQLVTQATLISNLQSQINNI